MSRDLKGPVAQRAGAQAGQKLWWLSQGGTASHQMMRQGVAVDREAAPLAQQLGSLEIVANTFNVQSSLTPPAPLLPPAAPLCGCSSRRRCVARARSRRSLSRRLGRRCRAASTSWAADLNAALHDAVRCRSAHHWWSRDVRRWCQVRLPCISRSASHEGSCTVGAGNGRCSDRSYRAAAILRLGGIGAEGESKAAQWGFEGEAFRCKQSDHRQ
jgi:hypothetical protein